ncbi:MAG TPA: DUF998 domain-containing protein [Euzebya sp.]|nr:DUF998 domain-containing protein [Euzebya sp.]
MSQGAAIRADIPLSAARLCLGAAASFVAALAALHVIKADVDPSWHFISEYAIGQHGWIMTAAFAALAVSHVAAFVMLRSQLPTRSGRVGLVMLLVAAAGLTIAALFPADPITTAPADATAGGQLHTLGGMLGLATPLAIALVTWRLARGPAWASARTPLIWAGAAAVAATLATIASLGIMMSQHGGQFGPGVNVGWSNRLEILAQCVWLMTLARQGLATTNRADVAASTQRTLAAP